MVLRWHLQDLSVLLLVESLQRRRPDVTSHAQGQQLRHGDLVAGPFGDDHMVVGTRDGVEAEQLALSRPEGLDCLCRARRGILDVLDPLAGQVHEDHVGLSSTSTFLLRSQCTVTLHAKDYLDLGPFGHHCEPHGLPLDLVVPDEERVYALRHGGDVGLG